MRVVIEGTIRVIMGVFGFRVQLTTNLVNL